MGFSGCVRLMFQDEAGFGRISEPKACWAPKGVRPIVPRLRIREYVYAYGATEPKTGESFFLVLPKTNTACMNLYLKELSLAYPDDVIILACDQATWHTTTKLEIPGNIIIYRLLPCTPEMNPQEQIWKEIRKRGFKNEFFHTLDKVIDKLCETICSLTPEDIVSITGREWIISIS